MKKYILILIAIIFLTGCTNINNLSIDEIVNNSINTRVEIFNNYRKGYKYYLPTGLKVTSREETNEIIKKGANTYYLYVDLISYYNKTNREYQENTESYYSKKIEKNDNFGYLEINNQENGKYLIEIMYNYAKIEVIVAENNLNNTIINAISILTSISYNDTIIKNMMSEEGYNYKEEEIDIFETVTSQNVLTQEMEEEIKTEEYNDPDLIK